jgi:hypothetical protein
VVFSQCWRPSDVGWQDDADAIHLEGECAVVLGPMQDACVYFGGWLAYAVPQPNRRFFLDLSAHCMAGRADSGRYDGRDDEVTECLDYALQMQMARLFAEARLTLRKDACLRVAALLRRYAATFEQAGAGARLRSTTDCCTSSQA